MSKYPFDDLAAAMRLSPAQAARHLRISGRTEVEYRRDGLSERVADRLAVRAGLHPAVVWPSWIGGALERQRERKRAIGRRSKAKMRATPEGAELNRARRRAYYAENGEYERKRERDAYRARRESA